MVLFIIFLVKAGLQKAKIERENFTFSSSDIWTRSRVFFASKNQAGKGTYSISVYTGPRGSRFIGIVRCLHP